MRALLVTVPLVLLLWLGYWFAGAFALRQGFDRALAAQSGAGPVAGYDGLAVSGFPTRFDLKITAPRLSDPARGLGWAAPVLSLSLPAALPWHIAATLPPTMTFTTPDGPASLTASQLTATAALAPDTALPFDRLTLAGQGLALRATGFESAAASAHLQTQRQAADPLTHAVTASLTTITLDPAFRMALQQGSDLPEQIDLLDLAGSVTLTAPLDRFAARTHPDLAALDIAQARLVWGDLSIQASGRIVPDATGLAEGRIEVTITNWRRLPPVLVAARLITPEAAPTVTRMMELLAQQGQDPDSLTLPLAFQSGRMSFGPIPLGPAPRIQRQ